MTVHVVLGAPFSGKTTLVEASCPPGVPRFDFDQVAGVVGGGDAPDGVRDVVAAMRRGLIGWLTDPETRPATDVWLVSGWLSGQVVARLDAVGAVFHVCDPGKGECVARAQRAGASEQVLQAIDVWYGNPPVVPGGEKGGGVEVLEKTFEGEPLVEAPGFVGYASVFGNVDSYGDVTVKGAFEATLKEWAAKGRAIPVLYGHDFADPFSNIGVVTDAVEDEKGLRVTASLDVDSNPKAAQVYRLLKEKRLSEMSFAFRVRKSQEGELDGKSVNFLRDVELFEVSVVPIGANREAGVVEVRADDEPQRKGTPEKNNDEGLSRYWELIVKYLDEGEK